MRSLKYKAYIKEYDKVVNVDRLGLNWDGSVQEIIVSEKELEGKNEWTDFQAEQFELMQYTGLKDKDGKEIYEGDILTWGNNVIAKVYYADDLAVFRCVIEGTEEFDLFTFNQEASIIGNIYENKELLNE